MRKTITIVAAAAAALTSTIGMAAERVEQRFVHEGRTYVFTTRQVGDRQVIDGRNYPHGSTFHLVVRGDTVSGMSGGVPVSFKTRAATGAAAGIQVAAR